MSSEGVEQPTGSVLHPDFSELQPAQGKLIWLRVYIVLHLVRPIKTRFRYACVPMALRLQYKISRWLILQ